MEITQKASLFRKIGYFKGKRRLAKALWGNTIKTGKNIWIKGMYDCIYKLPNLSDSVSMGIFADGIYEKDTHTFIKSKLPVGGVYLDLGANIGSILIPLCKTRPDIKAYCVEAAPWIYEVLLDNIKANKLENVAAWNNAIYDVDGLSLKFYSPESGFGKGSLLPVFEKVPVEVMSTTIDTLVGQITGGNISVIKIDIEGFEFFAFKGGESLLKRPDAPDIVFEFAGWAEAQVEGIKAGSAQDLILSYGYELYEILPGAKLKKMEKPMREGGGLLYATKKLMSF